MKLGISQLRLEGDPKVCLTSKLFSFAWGRGKWKCKLGWKRPQCSPRLTAHALPPTVLTSKPSDRPWASFLHEPLFHLLPPSFPVLRQLSFSSINFWGDKGATYWPSCKQENTGRKPRSIWIYLG